MWFWIRMLTLYTIESLLDVFSFDFNQIHIANLQFEPNEKQKKNRYSKFQWWLYTLCVFFMHSGVYSKKKIGLKINKNTSKIHQTKSLTYLKCLNWYREEGKYKKATHTHTQHNASIAKTIIQFNKDISSRSYQNKTCLLWLFAAFTNRSKHFIIRLCFSLQHHSRARYSNTLTKRSKNVSLSFYLWSLDYVKSITVYLVDSGSFFPDSVIISNSVDARKRMAVGHYFGNKGFGRRHFNWSFIIRKRDYLTPIERCTTLGFFPSRSLELKKSKK